MDKEFLYFLLTISLMAFYTYLLLDSLKNIKESIQDLSVRRIAVVLKDMNNEKEIN